MALAPLAGHARPGGQGFDQGRIFDFVLCAARDPEVGRGTRARLAGAGFLPLGPMGDSGVSNCLEFVWLEFVEVVVTGYPGFNLGTTDW